MSRFARAMTRPLGPAPRTAGSENRLYAIYALSALTAGRRRGQVR
jgi:hypothetical protein